MVCFFVPYVIISAYFVPNTIYHFFYITSFLLKIVFLFVALKSNYSSTIYNFIKPYLFFCLFSTLSLSIIHLFLGIYTPAPGWLWPINISIQELTMIVLFCTFFLYESKYKKIVLFSLFIILLSNRGSGKTALIIILSIPVIYYIVKNSRVCFWLLSNYIKIYTLVFVGLIIYVYIFEQEWVNRLYYQINSMASDKVDFYKRISLIIESLHYILTPDVLFFGGGFGVVNYLANVDSFLGNSPQILILTMLVYGGLTFFCIYMYLMHRCLVGLIDGLGSYESKIYSYILWFSVITFMTTHEYFNNPFLYVSLYIFIAVVKSKQEIINEK